MTQKRTYTKKVYQNVFVDSVDITAPKMVEVLIRDDGEVIWINIDGVCRLRACRIETLTVTDKRKEKIANGGHNQEG